MLWVVRWMECETSPRNSEVGDAGHLRAQGVQSEMGEEVGT